MEKGVFAAAPLFEDVILRMVPHESGIPSAFVISPAQARALAKSLTKAARAVEKRQA
jgi:hypothetical protein